MMKNKYTKRVSLLIMTIIIALACSSNDNSETDTPNPISLSFGITISSQNSLRVTVNNTSTGISGLNSYWTFFENGPEIVDGNGPESFEYEASGQYTITLTVEAPSGDIQLSRPITVTSDELASPLKDATNTFSVGMAVQSNRMDGQHGEILARDFNNLTAEYEMKMNTMYPSQGNYDFTAADAIVNFGVVNNMNIHGHTLIWHNSVPDWVENFSGTDQEFENMIEDYITTVMTRYAGVVRSWDVVNEAIEDGSNQLRNSVFRQRMGDNYISKCYQWARNADPNALLFYNDYSLTFDTGKQAAMFAIVDDLASQNLIDGIGAQMHIDIYFPSSTQIQSVVDGAISRGLKIHFAELDVRVNPNNDTSSLTEQRAIAQQNKVREVVALYNAIPAENKFAITIWGMRDNETWLVDFWGQPDWPLLYNNAFVRKKAYTGFLEALD